MRERYSGPITDQDEGPYPTCPAHPHVTLDKRLPCAECFPITDEDPKALNAKRFGGDDDVHACC